MYHFSNFEFYQTFFQGFKTDRSFEWYFTFKQVFGDDGGMYKLEDVQMHDFGQIGEVTITKDDTLFMKVCESFCVRGPSNMISNQGGMVKL